MHKQHSSFSELSLLSSFVIHSSFAILVSSFGATISRHAWITSKWLEFVLTSV
jgi:hypothetical protein